MGTAMTETVHNRFDAIDSEAVDLIGGFSQLDVSLRFTLFPTRGASRKKPLCLSLNSLAAKIKGTVADSKASLPWLKAAIFGSDRTPKNCLRHNRNVLAITGIEADYDAGDMSPEEARDRLEAAGLTGLIYTTPSHLQPGKGNRWRVILPCAIDRSPHEREALVARLNGLLGGTLAQESFALSQAFYFGNVTGKTPVQTFLIEGRRCIDEAEDLDAGAIGNSDREESASGDTRPPCDLSEEEIDQVLQLLDHDKWCEPYHGWLNVGMALHHQYQGEEAGFEKWCQFSADSSTFNADECRLKWESFTAKPGGITFASLLFETREARDSEKFDDLGEDEDSDEPDAEEDKPKAESKSRLTFMSPDECLTAKRREYIIKGFLSQGDIGTIVGAPGVGKSLLGPRLGYAVAQGSELFGMRTRQGGVFYVAAEDEHGMRGRVSALRKQHGEAPNFNLVCGVSDLLSKDSPDLKELRREVANRRPSIIFIDTLAMAFPGLEENAAEAMGRVVAVAKCLSKHGAAVVLIHHDTKDGANGLPRGHSVLNGALDVNLYLTKTGTGIVKGRLTKNRNGSCERDIAFMISTETLGVDEDGDKITVAIAEELAPGTAPKTEKVSPSAEAALSILYDLLQREPDTGPKSVAEDDWRKACLDSRTVSAALEEDSRRKAFKRSVAELTRKSRVNFQGGRYRLPVVQSHFEDFAEVDSDA